MTDSHAWLSVVSDSTLESPDQPSPTGPPDHHLETQFDGKQITTGETAPCHHCGDHLHEGRPLTARAYRHSDEPAYTIATVYCAGCAPVGLGKTTRGCDDVLLEADLGLAMAGQTHWTILVEPTIVATG
ncbi:hypothetical protein OB955_24420 [Halobacteria archaeon AArc-m2/3/4]|uniref:DUF8112 domain-containing protein n=1 Tax=Natronoglomus mannanivorans TaxID=2979990 RepID=A0ABT2QLS3_9EURY|nr:hypothetical protein [Halobacteria archaeon AArc-m2/3/4]